ncbi:MAG: TadA family conjugal transfer-associated ATPase [Jatrophihabitans sp.]
MNAPMAALLGGEIDARLVDDVVGERQRQQRAADTDGAGPLEPLLADPLVSDVLVNGPHDVWVDRGTGLQRVPEVRFRTEADVRRLACRLALRLGRRLDDAAPWVDASLPDGTRLHAILPPLTAHTTISLRVLARHRLDLAALAAAGTVPPSAEAILRSAVLQRRTCLISGGTGCGKTTLLGAMLDLVPADQRVVVIEDAAEIVTRHRHAVRLFARPPNVEGAGGVGLAELVRQSLRMRPDRVVVGEFRGAEIADLLTALNTGHTGGAATVHANSIADVPARLAALGALAGLDPRAVTLQAAAGVDLVLHLSRGPSGQRHLVEISELSRSGDALNTTAIWRSGP